MKAPLTLPAPKEQVNLGLGQCDDGLKVCARQLIAHFNDALPQKRMDPVRGYIGQRYEHKGTLLQARMGEDEDIWGFFLLRSKRKRAPCGVAFRIGEHEPTCRQKIKIKDPPSPTLFPGAAELCLDGM